MPTCRAANWPAILATEAEANRRLRMGLGFGKLGCFFGLIFGTFFAAIGHGWGALVVALCTADFAANLFVIKRGRFVLAGTLFELLLIDGFVLLTATLRAGWSGTPSPGLPAYPSARACSRGRALVGDGASSA